LEHLEEMDIFLGTYDLSKLNQNNIESLDISITSNVIEVVIKNLSTKKSPRPNGFTVELYQIFKELTPMLFKLFHKT
jgi:hypothetical protein